jgi:hypothetical protein
MSPTISELSFSNDHLYIIFHPLIMAFRTLILLVLLILPCRVVFSQQALSVPATLTRSPITIDGVLDEDTWKDAPVISNFIQLEPREGQASSRNTEVRVLFGPDDLYIGAIMYDDPSAIENNLGRRDEFNRADWLMISIDSYFNRRSAYTFAVNAAGVQLDGQQGGIRQHGPALPVGLDPSWNAIWFSAVRITEEGWVAEIRIPYSMLRFPDVESQTWGIHITRRMPRRGEIAEWPYIPRTERSNLVARYGRITDIREIEPRRNIQFRPYLLTGLDITESPLSPGTGLHSGRMDIGGDIKIGLGSNIMLDATVNPDFGQVEADPAVLNLTAFETFYAEKRPFFIEGADIFQFGIGISRLFYTRRIGAREPIIGAAKVSGRSASGLSFGILGASAGANLDPSHNYGVLRASQQFGEYSSAGAILTAYHSPLSDGIGVQSTTGGVDWDMRFFGNTYSFEGITAFSHRQSLAIRKDTEPGFMSGLTFRKREGIVDGHLTLLLFSDRYNPNDIGWTSFEQNFYESWIGLTYNIRGGQPLGPFQRSNIQFYHRQRYSYLEWWNMGDFMRVRFEMMTRRFNMIRIATSFSEIIGGYDIWETRGLDRWARPHHLELRGEYNTDERRNWKITPTASHLVYGDGGSENSLGLQGLWDIGTRFSFSGRLAGELENSVTAWASNETFRRDGDNWFIGNIAAAPGQLNPEDYTLLDDPGPLQQITGGMQPYLPGHYYLPLFGRRDTRSVDLTLRSSLTFTNTFSIQLYSQLFLARGMYNDFSILANPDLLEEFAGFPKKREFNYKNLQSNLVMRWEYRPGSTVYLVWSHGRRERDELNPLAPWGGSPYRRPLDSQLGDVFRIFPHNTFMIKLDYALF